MTVKNLAESLELEILSLPQPDRQIQSGYTGDLLSWVMGRAEADNAWVTIMNNVNILAVATLIDLSCIIIAENSEISEEIKTLATEKNINLLRSGEKAYDLCIKMSKLI